MQNMETLGHVPVSRGEQNCCDWLIRCISCLKGMTVAWASSEAHVYALGQAPGVKERREAADVATDGTDLTTAGFVFLSSFKSLHELYIQPIFSVCTTTSIGTEHHYHSWKWKDDLVLALKRVFMICLMWREVSRKSVLPYLACTSSMT